jgi:CTP synthase (UTP-ammonia lyase)
MGILDADSAEHGGSSKNLLIAPVACPVPNGTDGSPKLSGRRAIRIKPGCRLAAIYRTSDIEEEYFCNYEVNPAYHRDLEHAGLRLAAFDDGGELRAIELPDHRFFLATLYQPQLASVEGRPHPVIVEFLTAAAAR